MRSCWPSRLALTSSLALRAAPVLTLGPFLFLAASARNGAPFPVDTFLAAVLQSYVPEGMLPLLLALHTLGQRWAVGLYGTAAVVGLWLLRYRLESLLVLAGLLGAFTNGAFKEIVGRPRPDGDVVRVYVQAGSEYGFPSGDAQLFTIFFGLLFFLAPTLLPSSRWALLLRWFCGLLLLLVGPARVALGVHWPSDVLGGYLLGGFILWGLVALHRRFSPWSVAIRGQE